MKNVLGGVFNRFLKYFLAGLFAILPVVATVAIVAWVTGLLTQYVGPGTAMGRLLGAVGLTFSSDSTIAYIIGWVLVLCVILLVGLLVEAGARGFVQSVFDAMLSRLPLIGGIYSTSKQIVSLLDKKDDQLTGMRAVFCRFGEKNGCGILALLVSPETYRIDGHDYQIVIIPTAPVPVGGGLFFMPADTLRPVDLSVESLMSIYVSMGVTAPQFLHPQEAETQGSK